MKEEIILKEICPYSMVSIDKAEIPQGALDIDNKVRSNLFAWNGQFSPQFIETLLKKYSSPGDTVFDPFLGSGTTLCEAARKGLSAFGTELNVSAFFMAKTYEMVNTQLAERHRELFELDGLVHSITQTDDIIPTITGYINNHKDTHSADLLCTLVVLLDLYNNELSLELLNKKWESLKSIVMELPYSSREIKAMRGDARKISVSDNSASLLITSPPYINVFNYHQKYRKSVEALGYDVLKNRQKRVWL